MQYAHRKLLTVATVDEVRLVYEDRLVARHSRCWGRGQTRFNPVQYLAFLERKPGVFDHARPLDHWELPEGFAMLRRRLEAADPRRGTRDFIRALRLLERFSLEQPTGAIDYALDIDVIDAEACAPSWSIVRNRRSRSSPSIGGRIWRMSAWRSPTSRPIRRCSMR